jgi:hypothetical protein
VDENFSSQDSFSLLIIVFPRRLSLIISLIISLQALTKGQSHVGAMGVVTGADRDFKNGEDTALTFSMWAFWKDLKLCTEF